MDHKLWSISYFGIYLSPVRINGSKEIIESVYLFFSGLCLTTVSSSRQSTVDLKFTVKII